ncbi:MAG TPA: DUF484 family protein [Caulobacteraceae bacterium]|jgi:hypothetical protein
MDFAESVRIDADDQDDAIKALIRAHRDMIIADSGLLAELGLRLDAANIVDFGPEALSRVAAAHRRESGQRKRLEAVSKANFAAQTRTHASVIDLIAAENQEDLARRMDVVARMQFGLLTGVLALESEGAVPVGWRRLAPGQIDQLIGRGRPVKLGVVPTAIGLFGDLGPIVASTALVRLVIGEDRRQGVAAFASVEASAFAADMGSDLVSFLSRVIEKTAERWALA